VKVAVVLLAALVPLGEKLTPAPWVAAQVYLSVASPALSAPSTLSWVVVPATFDGLALAWAIAHRLAERNRCLSLFATHYFELTALGAELEGCANVHFDAAEHKDGIVFLHAVAEGPANRSYGLQVAKLAGVPAETVRQAKAYLARLDQFSTRNAAQDDLFGSTAPAAATVLPAPDPRAIDVLERLLAIEPDALSPREALEALYALKKLAEG